MADGFRLVSADSHINEPKDLWQDGLPAKYKDRAARIEHFEQGDGWIIEGARDPINFGLTSSAARPDEAVTKWIRWEDVQPHGYDPAARLEAQDADGTRAEVLYPSPRMASAMFWNTDDREFHLASIRAYNDWLSEFAGYAPDRLAGVALLPNVGVDAAVQEFQRVLKLPGIKGVSIGKYPNNTLDICPEDDALWAACEESGVPLSIHVSLTTGAPTDNTKSLRVPGDVRFYDVPARISQFIYENIFDRFPNLKLVFAETDCGWLPYLMEQLDLRLKRFRHNGLITVQEFPSFYIKRNTWHTYITDRFAIEARHAIGVDRMLWSSDFPHVGTDWPHSWDVINEHFQGVPADEKRKILADNAAALYQLPER